MYTDIHGIYVLNVDFTDAMVGFRIDSPPPVLMEDEMFNLCIVLSNVPRGGRAVPIIVDIASQYQGTQLSPNFRPGNSL